MDGLLLPALGGLERKKASQGDYGAVERIVDRVSAYDVLKTATELYMMAECGLLPDETLMTQIEKLGTDAGAAPARRASAADRELKKLRAMEGNVQGRNKNDVGKLKSSYLSKLSRTIEVVPYYQLIIERLEDRPLKPDFVTDGAWDYGILRDAATRPPMIELIWSYWHEEGMLRADDGRDARAVPEHEDPGGHDPLAEVRHRSAASAEQPLWGWIQDESDRLTVPRRAYEYDHEYGCRCWAARCRPMRPRRRRSQVPARRSTTCSSVREVFYKQDDDTTVIADGFPVLNALQGGAHAARRGSAQPVRRPAMGRARRDADRAVDAGAPGDARVPRRADHGRLRGAVDGPGRPDEADAAVDDITITHFRDLGVFGEQILLSSGTATGCTGDRPAGRRTGRATGVRRSRCTSTRTAPSPAST